MPNLKEVKEQLKAAGISQFQIWNSGAELVALVEALDSTEVIEAACHGKYDDNKGYAVATQGRVVIAGGTLFKRSAESFNYDKIASITAGTSELEIHASGNSAKLKSIMDVKAARRFADHVRSKMQAPKQETTTASGDVATQLERLAGLLDRGLLTQEEFQEQKRKLL